jgi:hypothetical protein
MHVDNVFEPLGDRARRCAASAMMRLAICMLCGSHRLHRAGIIGLAGARHAVHWSDKVWGFGWGLVRRKRRS